MDSVVHFELPFEDQACVDASIGANLAIQALQKHSSILSAIALSPGLDYHGSSMPFFILEKLMRFVSFLESARL